MPKRKKKTNLKDQITVILVVLIVAAIVAVTYHTHSSAKNVAATATSTPTATASPSPNVSGTPKPSASPTPTPSINAKNYLYIKELGIKLPLTSGLYDVEYDLVGVNGGQGIWLEFSTASITSFADGQRGCPTSDQPLGSYVAYTSAQANPGGGDFEAGTLVANQNGYFIYYHHAQSTCGNTQADINKVSALIDPLHTAVSLAQPIN